MRQALEEELAEIREQAARLANFDLTIPGGRAATKFAALVARERELMTLAEIDRETDPDSGSNPRRRNP